MENAAKRGEKSHRSFLARIRGIFALDGWLTRDLFAFFHLFIIENTEKGERLLYPGVYSLVCKNMW